MSGLKPGETIVIYGGGPVGLMAALSAGVKGAAMVVVVDRHRDRLRLAEEIGAIAIEDSMAPGRPGDGTHQRHRRDASATRRVSTYRGRPDLRQDRPPTRPLISSYLIAWLFRAGATRRLRRLRVDDRLTAANGSRHVEEDE